MNHIPNIPRRDADEAERGGPWGRSRPPSPPPYGGPPRGREPAITVPGVVSALIALLVVIELARGTLSFYEDLRVLVWLAFIPARYASEGGIFPGGLAADAWTFVTYALLHGSWMHLITNGIWMVAFGSAVAKRFGAVRFLVLCVASAAGGAAAHLVFHYGEQIPVVGASAAVAGLMAAAARFVFDRSGPIVMRRTGDAAYRRPALSLTRTLANRSALAFIGIFFLINIGIGVAGNAVGGVSVASEAHLGGFLVGLLGFRYLDPIPR